MTYTCTHQSALNPSFVYYSHKLFILLIFVLADHLFISSHRVSIKNVLLAINKFTFVISLSIQGYSRDTSDENFVICNPKYKKPLELDILFNLK
jgi:hypothetical protein